MFTIRAVMLPPAMLAPVSGLLAMIVPDVQPIPTSLSLRADRQFELSLQSLPADPYAERRRLIREVADAFGTDLLASVVLMRRISTLSHGSGGQRVVPLEPLPDLEDIGYIEPFGWEPFTLTHPFTVPESDTPLHAHDQTNI